MKTHEIISEKFASLTEEQKSTLVRVAESIGANVWEKGEAKRLYLNDEFTIALGDITETACAFSSSYLDLKSGSIFIKTLDQDRVNAEEVKAAFMRIIRNKNEKKSLTA